MTSTAPRPTIRLSRTPGGLVWHPLLGPSGDGVGLQQPLPLDCGPVDAPDRAVSPHLNVIVVSLVTALIEVLTGRRPPHQLHEWASTAVTDQLESLGRGHQQRDWRLRSLRAQQPSRHKVEATVHLIQAGRSRAAAVCISHQQRRWTITEFCITPSCET